MGGEKTARPSATTLGYTHKAPRRACQFQIPARAKQKISHPEKWEFELNYNANINYFGLNKKYFNIKF